MKILSAIGIAAGLAGIAAILITGDTYGYPGSERYRIYETFNRAMVFFLLLQVCSLLAFQKAFGSRLGLLGRFGLCAAILGWLGMAAGTAVEFWLYSNLPYSGQNMRHVAYGVFSLGGLVSGVALVLLGIDLYRRRFLSRTIAIVIMLYIVFDIIFFFIGGSIFLATVVWSILLGVLALRDFAVSTQSAEISGTLKE